MQFPYRVQQLCTATQNRSRRVRQGLETIPEKRTRDTHADASSFAEGSNLAAVLFESQGAFEICAAQLRVSMHGYELAQLRRNDGYDASYTMSEVIGSKESESAQRISQPSRLMDLNAMADYLGGLSYWSCRDLVLSGRVPRVEIPLSYRTVRGKRGKRFKVEAEAGLNLRRILVDRQDLDLLIESWKSRGCQSPTSEQETKQNGL